MYNNSYFFSCGFLTETEPIETESEVLEPKPKPAMRLRLRFLIFKTEGMRFRLRFYPKTAPKPHPLSPSIQSQIVAFCKNIFLTSEVSFQHTIQKQNRARQEGVEPSTFCLGNRRSIHWATGALCLNLVPLIIQSFLTHDQYAVSLLRFEGHVY